MSGVFLVGPNNSLTRMPQSDYLSEADIQQLIATHPALLGSCTAQTEEDECELLLIKREMGVPDQENGNDRWAVDHFYIDQNCIPVLVEVKRSKSGDMRRAIVGQLLDYAAHAAVYWSIDSVKHCLQKQYGDPERAQEELDAFLESAGLEENDFWRRVEKNFEEHNIRIVFVADELPPQLCRVIEFLNGQMKDVEVLGIELRQFRTDTEQTTALRAIAPSVVGRTSEAELSKGRARGAKRSFEQLDRVVEEYRKLSGNAPAVDNRSGHYRQIHLGGGILKGYHYEFQFQVRRGLSCEFHAEVTPRPDFVEALEVLARSVRSVGGTQLEFVQRGKTPGLRITPSKQDDPAAVALAMMDFIQTTRAPIEKAILATR
ncbi:hypothetical protein QTH89_25865 [Variovorax sp. J22G21]|uniref:hypothetical protein n=1 Tax=Variovorax fucosicus TaxID=3053517 RepID=UPI002577F753|nr:MULTISPECIES: hypothetical protein [unclassified Variovorax]MDM0039784.1 hypothetical protein [Variovorax sp. J22R193]MDM0064667.1 hypothetical protein [Variovorax sp. J22G21]